MGHLAPFPRGNHHGIYPQRIHDRAKVALCAPSKIYDAAWAIDNGELAARALIET